MGRVRTMNRLFFNTLLIAAVAVIHTGLIFAQKPEAAASLPKPERLVLVGIGEPEPGVSWEKQTFITESFYPIGWSRDGKFAYFVEPPDEACGCYFGKFVIQDLKTDKILWQDDYTGEMEVVPEENIESFWPKKQKEYAAKLKEHGIEPSSDFRLLHPSIDHDGDVLTPRIDVRIKGDGVFEVEGAVRLNMDSKRSGTKVIMRDIYKKDEINTIRNAEVAGSLLSPFEPRAAVIVVQEMRGYEGPPHITTIKVVGSTLKTGFKN